MRFFLSGSQQNGELLLISFTRLELVDEAETSLSGAGLAVLGVGLLLSVASSSVNAGALAERIGVTNGSVPTLELVGAVIDVLGITIANGSNKVAAESRDVRAELNTPALESSGDRKIIFSRNFTNSIDNFKGVGDAGLVIKVSGLGKDLGNAEVIVTAEDEAVAVINVVINVLSGIAVHRHVAGQDNSSLASLVAQASGEVTVSIAGILTGILDAVFVGLPVLPID